MNPNPTQPPLGATPEPSAEERRFVEEIDTILSCGNPQSGFAYKKIARMIAGRVNAATATARAALAQCEERVKEANEIAREGLSWVETEIAFLKTSTPALEAAKIKLQSAEAVGTGKRFTESSSGISHVERPAPVAKTDAELIAELRAEVAAERAARRDEESWWKEKHDYQARAESAESALSLLTAKLAQCEEKLRLAYAKAAQIDKAVSQIGRNVDSLCCDLNPKKEIPNAQGVSDYAMDNPCSDDFQMSAKILLPDGVADSWFLITAGGEVYDSRVCRGTDLIRALADLCFGDKDEEHETLDKYAEEIADGDFWYVNNGRCVHCSLACGEDPDIEISLIDDPTAVSALNGEAKLTAAHAKALEDSARLDWLSQRAFRRPGPASQQVCYAIVDSSVWPPVACSPQEKPTFFRAAIDAAIAATPATTGKDSL